MSHQAVHADEAAGAGNTAPMTKPYGDACQSGDADQHHSSTTPTGNGG
jgi:hypothetical protein